MQRDVDSLTPSQRAMNHRWWQRQQAEADEWVARHRYLKRLRGLASDRLPTVAEFRELADQVGFIRDRPEAGPSGWMWEMYAALYDPVELALEKLERGDPAGTEVGLRFLEADVYCLHSGYVSSRVLRALSGIDLSERDAARLRALIIRSLDSSPYRHFKLYRRLAREVDSDELRRDVRARIDTAAATRARLVLDTLGEPASG
jgi:hypothetical protein